jgi:phosphoheptose isomerase
MNEHDPPDALSHDSSDDSAVGGDLGFEYALRKSGEVALMRHGKLVTTLRGSKAHAFAAEIEGCSRAEAQQLMARLTGNYKRGNERRSSRQPREPR